MATVERQFLRMQFHLYISQLRLRNGALLTKSIAYLQPRDWALGDKEK